MEKNYSVNEWEVPGRKVCFDPIKKRNVSSLEVARRKQAVTSDCEQAIAGGKSMGADPGQGLLLERHTCLGRWAWGVGLVFCRAVI